MITYQLRTSGGTHTTWSGICSAINSAIGSDNITVWIQGGQTFDTGGAIIGTGNDGELNSLTLNFMTKPTEQGTPATITGQIRLNLVNSMSSGGVYFNNFIHIVDNIPDGESPFYNQADLSGGGGA